MPSSRLRGAALSLAIGWAGGACVPSPREGAIAVTVNIGPAARASCVRVVARSEEGTAQETAPMERAGRDRLIVAVSRRSGLGETVSLVARGYLGQGCDEPLWLNEESAAVTGRFEPGQVRPVTLELLAPAIDLDEDGHLSTDGGGSDCDDSSATVFPKAPERCGDGRLNDCEARPLCQGQGCLGLVCAAGATCEPAGQCYERACANGLDDDGDGQSDCQDPDCAAQPCSDGTPCTWGEQCAGLVCALGTRIGCSAPPGSCLASPGACDDADGGCTFALLPTGAPCDAGVCTTAGACVVAGSFLYAPSNFDPAGIGPIGGAVTLGCLAVFDSTPDAATAFPVWCAGEPQPQPVTIVQDAGPDAVLLAMRGLTVTADGGLQLIGSRPVILAVYGDADVSGHLRADAMAAVSGAGGGSAPCDAAPGEVLL
ncbi:MAG: MopE-related protein, partial [Myxococcaceae bacterium]